VLYGHFAAADTDLPADAYRWYYREGASAGVVPTNDGRHCVFAAVPAARYRQSVRQDPATGFCAVLAECSPALAAAVEGAAPESRLWAFAGRRGFLRQASGPGWALVGDAGYFKDPLTAHGITDALRDAELLAAAAAQDTRTGFAAYAATRDALSLPLFEATDAIASFDWDLEEVKHLHQMLNKAMKPEVEHLLSLGPSPRNSAALDKEMAA
jgi:menaquinone-9 beta-reductase